MPAGLARGLRSASIVALALAAAPPASADVLVPADPAAPRAAGIPRCIAGAGDVLVYERDERGPPAPAASAEIDAGPGQRYALADPGARHLRLRVTAADRAGNVSERSRRVALSRR